MGLKLSAFYSEAVPIAAVVRLRLGIEASGRLPARVSRLTQQDYVHNHPLREIMASQGFLTRDIDSADRFPHFGTMPFSVLLAYENRHVLTVVFGDLD